MRRKKRIWCTIKLQDGTVHTQPLRRGARPAAGSTTKKTAVWKRRAGGGAQELNDFLRWMLYPKTNWQRPH